MIDAMKQALQALEQCVCDEQFRDKDLEARARAALRAAIEAAERAGPGYWQEEARRYAENADYWRGKYEAAIEHPPAITDEMVEKAAVAAFTYNRQDGDGHWDELPQHFQKYWLGQARAALEAAWGVKHVE